MINPKLNSKVLKFLACFGGVALLSCAAMQGQTTQTGSNSSPETTTQAMSPNENSGRSDRLFSEPNEIDKILDSKPQTLPAVKPAVNPIQEMLNTSPPTKTNSASFSKSKDYCIQIDALSDMDAAQARKAKLEKTLGEKIDLVFDAPYYKLRLGNFSSKKEAEDKLVDLAGKNLQGFVVKQ